MSTAPTVPDRITLAPGLEISRIITGLWQVADMERDGGDLDLAPAVDALAEYVAAGFDTFDMADHYGSAEIIAGRCVKQAQASGGTVPSVFTKWCPEPANMTAEAVRAGVEERLQRLDTDCVDLLQFHWWSYEDPRYLDAMAEFAKLQEEGKIKHLGLTNFNADHLRVLVKNGVNIVSNQISFSLLDRRAAEEMSNVCLENDVKLLAYGTLGGGFLSDRWVGKPEPAEGDIKDWSKMKYKRFIDTIGGWDVLQNLLSVLKGIADKHGVSVANVATRWVLQQPAVGAIIVGARLGESEHRADNLKLMSFTLDGEDLAAIDGAASKTQRIKGDCGDEYRRPPFLTASGDLSHHLNSQSKFYGAKEVVGRTDTEQVDTGSIWEEICGFSRAVRKGKRILVSGTTATDHNGNRVCPDDAAGQTVFILDKISASIAALGGSLEDVIRTTIYLKDGSQWEPVSRVHGRYFGDIRPANTLIEVSDIIDGYALEIETEAELD